MCTSFVTYSNKKTMIGMNFDISERPIKMVVKNDTQLLFLQYDNGQYLPAFAFNKSGIFMNLHEVEPNEDGAYRRGKNCVHIMRLFEDVLSEKIELQSLKQFLDEKQIVNVPNYSVHSLIAGPDHIAFVVEPGRGYVELNTSDCNFLVQTNFSLLDQPESTIGNVIGKERYKKAYTIIEKSKEHIDFDMAMNVLEETSQSGGDYPTQVSIVFLPEEGHVYFSLKGDFSKTFVFSFHDNTIRTYSGFISSNQHAVTNKGILLTELARWFA